MLEHVKLVDSKFAEFKIAPIAFGLQYGRIIVAISGLGYVVAGGY